jgi:hypothetical protein
MPVILHSPQIAPLTQAELARWQPVPVRNRLDRGPCRGQDRRRGVWPARSAARPLGCLIPDFPGCLDSPPCRKRNAWRSIDARDLGEVVRLCLQYEGLGYQVSHAVTDMITADLPATGFPAKYAPDTPLPAPWARLRPGCGTASPGYAGVPPSPSMAGLRLALTTPQGGAPLRKRGPAPQFWFAFAPVPQHGQTGTRVCRLCRSSRNQDPWPGSFALKPLPMTSSVLSG